MRTSVTTILWLGIAALLTSFVAVLLAPTIHGTSPAHRHETIYGLDLWVQRTFLWLGLIFLAGFVLDNVRWRNA